METLKIVNGREFRCDFIAKSSASDQVYIRLVGETIADIAETFSKKDNVKKIICGEELIYGYTQLVAVIPEPGAIKVVLRKE